MLILCKNLHQLHFGELMEVYQESVGENGAEFYPRLSAAEQILQAQQDFYAYLRQDYFSREEDVYCIWEEKGRYLCALRLERYQDGLLLEALETRPEFRRQGYAEMLIRTVMETLDPDRVYSHIGHRNIPSQAVHRKCGFVKIADQARYTDGSVDSRCGTYLYERKSTG